METTIVYWGYIEVILGYGKENGNYYSILGLYWCYIGVILGIYFTKRRPKVCTLHMHRPWAKQVQDFGLSFAGPC